MLDTQYPKYWKSYCYSATFDHPWNGNPMSLRIKCMRPPICWSFFDHFVQSLEMYLNMFGIVRKHMYNQNFCVQLPFSCSVYIQRKTNALNKYVKLLCHKTQYFYSFIAHSTSTHNQLYVVRGKFSRYNISGEST